MESEPPSEIRFSYSETIYFELVIFGRVFSIFSFSKSLETSLVNSVRLRLFLGIFGAVYSSSVKYRASGPGWNLLGPAGLEGDRVEQWHRAGLV